MTTRALTGAIARLVLALLGVITAAGIAPVDAGQAPKYLGFSLGEERRYVLGPTENLYVGEQAMWSIRLREVLADPPDAIFELAHVWNRGERVRHLAIGTVIAVQSNGELHVNRHGFPVQLRFETERQLFGMGSESYAIRYEFQNGRFEKLISAGGRDLEHRARHFSNDELDLDVPLGMYPFGAEAIGCELALPPESMAQPGVMPGASPGAAGMVPGQNVVFAGRLDCKEPLFANPGLLSLVMPALWETGTGELDFVVLTPAGYYGMPGISGGGALPGVSVMMQDRPFDSQEASHPRANSDIEHLRYQDRVRVEVGERMRDAWLFDGMHDFRAVYVDDDGVVLRVDLSPDAAMMMPRAGGQGVVGASPGSGGTRELWVRLLYPSEY
ncbi:MAG: hypothetical protein PVJ49_04685 [Acidobacteriota bacterium]